MKITFRYLLIVILAFSLIPSCDVEDDPYLVPEDNPGPGPDPTEKVRKLLLEEFTGHTCVNCPEGCMLADDLKNQYGEQLIQMSIHAGTFAEPSTAPYTADYRTQAGNDLNAYYNVLFYPSAMINRTKYNGQYALFTGVWQDAIETLINLPPDAHIDLSLEYEAVTRTLTGNVSVEFLNDFPCDFNICFYLLESGIISAQKNDNSSVGTVPEILDYEHNHMLRDAYNGAWGTEIAAGGVSAGQVETTTFTMTLHDGWNQENCAIVAFVYNAATREVVQAEEKEVR